MNSLAILDQQIARKERRIRDLPKLEIETAALLEARRLLVGNTPMTVPQVGASDAAMEFVRNNPGKYNAVQVAELLNGKFFTRSDDARRVMVSTLSNLVRDGVVKRDSLGRLAP